MSALGLLRSAGQVRAALRRRAVYAGLLQRDDEGCPVEGNMQAWRAGRLWQEWRLPVIQRPVAGEAPAVSGIPPRNGRRGQPEDMQLGPEHPGAGS